MPFSPQSSDSEPHITRIQFLQIIPHGLPDCRHIASHCLCLMEIHPDGDQRVNIIQLPSIA